MKTMKRRLLAVLHIVLLISMSCGGCDDAPGTNGNPNSAINPTNNGSADGGADTGNIGDGGPVSDMAVSDQGPTLDRGLPPQDAASPFTLTDAGMVDCGGIPCACDDGLDNDGDGLIDGFDPECTGPFDNDEESFATGIPGDNQDPKWQDCFFDGNSGAGDDKCRYHTDCLTGDLPATDPDCQVSQQCFDFCRPLTPNGCDCFGCCEVFDATGTKYEVVIGGTCSVAKLGTAECMECTQTDTCLNTCGRCELCLGRTIGDLPDDCFVNTPDMGGTPDGGVPNLPACDDGETPCATSLDCPTNNFCQLGCCIPVVP